MQRIIILISILLGSWNMSHSQIRENFERHEHIYKAAKMPYRLLKPIPSDSIDKFPLVIFLHGAAEVGNDNEKQLNHGVLEFAKIKKRQQYPAYVLAPQCPRGKSWSSTDLTSKPYTTARIPTKELRQVNELLQSLVKEHPIDTSRIYVIGLSTGTFGAWELLYRWPENYAAALMISGSTSLQTITPQVAKIPVWIFNDTTDKQTDIATVDQVSHQLDSLKATYKYTRNENPQQNCMNQAFGKLAAIQWLFAQHK